MSPLRRPDPIDPDRGGDDAAADGPFDVADWGELSELPVAVVCASCGRSECGGDCRLSEAPTSSGVVLVVPWERPGQGAWSRFWTTTRLGVEGAEVFFTNLPDGAVGPSLSYAAAAELLAAGSCVLGFAAVGLPLLGLLLPAFARSLLTEPAGRAAVARVLVAAWLSFTALLVGVHALHGAALHRLARGAGSSAPRATLRRALRFGLYSAGFDVVACPVGLAWLLSLRGSPSRILDLLFSASHRATGALLRGVYNLDPASVDRVRRRGVWLSVVAVLVGIVLCVAAVIAAA